MANSVSPLVGHSPGAARRADLLSFPRGVASLASFSSQYVSCSASWPIRFRHSSVLLQALPVVLTCSHFLAASLPSPRLLSQPVSCSASCPIRFRHSSVILQALPVVLTCSHFLAVSPPSPRLSHCRGELLGLVTNSVSPLVGHSPGAARRADLLSFPCGVASLASFSSQRVSCSASWPIRFRHSSVLLHALPVVLTCSHFLVVSLPSPRLRPQAVSCSASCPIRFRHSSVILHALPVVLTCSHFLAVSLPSPRSHRRE